MLQHHLRLNHSQGNYYSKWGQKVSQKEKCNCYSYEALKPIQGRGGGLLEPPYTVFRYYCKKLQFNSVPKCFDFNPLGSSNAYKNHFGEISLPFLCRGISNAPEQSFFFKKSDSEYLIPEKIVHLIKKLKKANLPKTYLINGARLI